VCSLLFECSAKLNKYIKLKQVYILDGRRCAGYLNRRHH